jgi:hypothetical protein
MKNFEINIICDKELIISCYNTFIPSIGDIIENDNNFYVVEERIFNIISDFNKVLLFVSLKIS